MPPFLYFFTNLRNLIIVKTKKFNFMIEELHLRLLRNLAGWLRPGGRLILWNDMVSAGNRSRFHRFLEAQVADVKSMLDRDEIEINEPQAVFVERLERTLDRARRKPHSNTNTKAVTWLLASVGLRVLDVEETWPVGLLPDPTTASFPCGLVVAGLAAQRPAR